MKIAILDDYQDVVKTLDCFSLLAEHEVTVFKESYPQEVLFSKLIDFDALVLIRERTFITEFLLENLPKLKIISQTGKVSHHIDLTLCEKYGVKVLEGRGSPIAPSELYWALLMSASRHIPTYTQMLKQGQWQDSGSLGLGRTLKGLTFGIWGYGKIGKRIAQYAKAFEMSVMVWGSDRSRKAALIDGFIPCESKAEFFSRSDIVSLHLRLNAATSACVRADDLALMKPDSLFINTSRSELIEKSALYNELVRIPSKRAALDVYDIEPTSLATEPLLTLPNGTGTPHLGYVEKNSYELYFKIAFENLLKSVLVDLDNV